MHTCDVPCSSCVEAFESFDSFATLSVMPGSVSKSTDSNMVVDEFSVQSVVNNAE